MTHTIVAGVDGSADSFAALASAAETGPNSPARDSRWSSCTTRAWAHAFAAAYEGSAEPIIEQTPTDLEATSPEHTFDLLADRPLEWTFDVTAGDAARELIVTATTAGASLIVVGGRGHSVLGGLILGSVAQEAGSVVPDLGARRPQSAGPRPRGSPVQPAHQDRSPHPDPGRIGRRESIEGLSKVCMTMVVMSSPAPVSIHCR